MELLQRGADAASTDLSNGLNAVHFAARSGHADTLKVLLSSCGDEEKRLHMVNATDKRGCTPAFLAHQLGDDGNEAFEILLQYGAKWTNLAKK